MLCGIWKVKLSSMQLCFQKWIFQLKCRRASVNYHKNTGVRKRKDVEEVKLFSDITFKLHMNYQKKEGKKIKFMAVGSGIGQEKVKKLIKPGNSDTEHS